MNIDTLSIHESYVAAINAAVEQGDDRRVADLSAAYDRETAASGDALFETMLNALQAA